jgi:hypothetical protein
MACRASLTSAAHPAPAALRTSRAARAPGHAAGARATRSAAPRTAAALSAGTVLPRSTGPRDHSGTTAWSVGAARRAILDANAAACACTGDLPPRHAPFNADAGAFATREEQKSRGEGQ